MARQYEMIWRTNYESYAAGAWLLALLAMMAMWMWAPMPQQPFIYAAFFVAFFFLKTAQKAWSLWTVTMNLSGKSISFITDRALLARMDKRKGSIWLGHGFNWNAVHTQRLYELKRVNPQTIYPPRWVMRAKEWITGEQVAALDDDTIGAPWIHGVEPDEGDIYVPFQHFTGNTLILGINRCGKTRALELIVEQAIAFGHCVISIDPKGDQEYESSMRAACKATGREKDFARFHLAFPRSSVRLDPLKNYTNPSDLPSRIAALMGGSDDDPFQKFAWNVLNSVILGMLEVGEKPSLVRIRTYVDIGVADLLTRVLLQYLDQHLPRNWEVNVAEFAKTLKQTGKGRSNDDGEINVRQSLNLMLAYYGQVLVPRHHDNEAIKALSTIYKHDAAHYSKMIANLIPIMAMLTTGELGPLLSPDPLDTSDPRPMSDLQALIDSKAVVYIGLDALANRTISSAVGSMLLSDLTSVAASVYNYKPDQARTNKIILIVDETSVVVNEPFIELLNKAPGAGFVVFSAAQTVPDFSARFNSMDKARQMLGNFNNLIAMRIKDKVTMEFVVETFDKTYVQAKMLVTTNATATKTSVAHFSGSIQERVSDTLEDMVPPGTFVALPNWQYYGSFSGGRLVKGRLPIITH